MLDFKTNEKIIYPSIDAAIKELGICSKTLYIKKQKIYNKKKQIFNIFFSQKHPLVDGI